MQRAPRGLQCTEDGGDKQSRGPLENNIYEHSLLTTNISTATPTPNPSQLMSRTAKASEFYSRFFTEEQTRKFLHVQKNTDALVSGSFVLSWLSGGSFVPNDMDIFVSRKHASIIARQIVESNYHFDPMVTIKVNGRKISVEQPSELMSAVEKELNSWNPNTGWTRDRYTNSNIAGVFNFVNTSGRIIQVVATRCEPVDAILAFHSTVVMNFATCDEVVCLFPNNTLERKRNLQLLDSTTFGVSTALQKYESRGWTTLYTISAWEAINGDEWNMKYRWIGDKHCEVVKFEESAEDGEKADVGEQFLKFWRLDFIEERTTRLTVMAWDRQGPE
ncbi:hypothetical protein VNI00_018501 [Paramarasmius palmivorus]|uniref:Uncharacterized protein n=1 Tax=Paramarasmius palmivorus TaxID=297713 RepID=A0AAW0AY30_9AGAR